MIIEQKQARLKKYLNRDMALLKFNERVLALAENGETPILERLRFVCIVSSNLDEFFEVRVASLKDALAADPEAVGMDDRRVQETISDLFMYAQHIVAKQYALLSEEIYPALAKEGVAIHLHSDWSDAQRKWAHHVFKQDVQPLLTPIGLDPAHPFPRTSNKSLNFIVELKGTDAFGRKAPIAIIQAPRALPRLIKMPKRLSGNDNSYVMLTSFIQSFIDDLFPGMQVKGCYQWRLTRNSDLFVDDDEMINLRQALEGELPHRHFGDAIRLEISHTMPESLETFLLQQFSLQMQNVFRINGPVNLVRLMTLVDLVARHDLKYPYFHPEIPKYLKLKHKKDIFNILTERDVLLHHPYQSFHPVVTFIQSASNDPDVIAIKQTIYRTGEDSEIMQCLIHAAQAGKEVTVVLELMARFDEQTNIYWATRMEKAGVHVVYGVVGHKTHAKMCLVLRKEKGKIKQYVHLGTGNYHPRTAKLYTDFGLFTSNTKITQDIAKVFALLTCPTDVSTLKYVLQAPFNLHSSLVSKIRREARLAKAKKEARIMVKVNTLTEPTIIQELYNASKAGVQIDLIVRGACILRPGVPGLSENIRVRSIIGRFLEHSRVYYFYNSGKDELYLSSADWMDRNFFRRIEIAVPIEDEHLKKRIFKEAFEIALKDNQQAWEQLENGDYQKVEALTSEPVNIHGHLLEMTAQYSQ